MLGFLRRLRNTIDLSRVSFCDSCSRVCTTDCWVTAHHDRVHTTASTYIVR